MDSDKIAAICVMHMMKTLFQQFQRDMHEIKDEGLMIQKEEEFQPKVIKVASIHLFKELGELFNSELKQTMAGGTPRSIRNNQDI